MTRTLSAPRGAASDVDHQIIEVASLVYCVPAAGVTWKVSGPGPPMRLTFCTSAASVTGSRGAGLPVGVTVTMRFASLMVARPAGASTVTWLAVPPWPEMVNVLVSPVKLKTVARPALVKVPALAPVGV